MTYQHGEMHLPARPWSGLRRIHQEISNETANKISQLRVAESRGEEQVQTNETMKHIIEKTD